MTATVTPADLLYGGDLLQGRWRIEAEIDRGGMGIVYRAWDRVRAEHVALKLLSDDAFIHPDLVYRFRREGRITSSLRSPNAVRVHCQSELASGRPFFVMELLNGKHLGVVARDRGRIPPSELVGWMRGVCDAVGEAHRAGIVHRDLKLGNLFLAGSTVKVLDFGIAKRHESSLALTGTGVVLGTPCFMPPEQFSSARDVDERGDVWALGVCIYRLAAGRFPFAGKTMPELCRAISLGDPLPARQANPSLSSSFERVVMRCLERNPLARYANAHALDAALKALDENRYTLPPPLPARVANAASVTRMHAATVRH